jgi:HEAT repeat protein/S1-C subfamily serine protease
MIVFSCPACDAELEAADSRAGAPVKCPDCGERFKVPMRGRRGPAAREREPERRVRQGPPSRGSRRRERDDYDEPERSGSKQGTVILLASIGGVAVLGLAALVLILVMGSGKKEAAVADADPVVVQRRQVTTTPRETKPPDTKPEQAKNTEAVATTGPESVGSDNSGQTIYKHLLKSVAWILVRVGQGGMSGTGSLIDRQNRLVLTNNHVVGDSSEILVFFPTYEQGKLLAERDRYLQQTREQDLIRARVLAKDPKRDLALLQIDRVPDGIEALPVAKSSTAPGLSVHSIGNPGTSGALWIYTSGTVRQIYHKQWKTQAGEHEALIVETQSPTNPGDSGGPLVNVNGELVGVTQGLLVNAQLVSLFIDVTEATDFIQNTCRSSGIAWARNESRLNVLGSIGVPGLIRNLEHADSKVRSNAAQALGNLGPDAKVAVAPLLRLLATENDALTRRLAIEALHKIGPPDSTEVNVLTTALQNDQAEVRSYAASSIGKIGPDARSALPALLKAAKDTDAGVRQNALRALGKFGSENKEAVVPVLAAAIKDSNRDVRLAAGEAVASLGAFGTSDIPLLLDLLKHPDADVRASAARALGQIGRAAKTALPALLEAMKGGDKSVRKAGIEAVASIGGPPKQLVPLFTDALTESDKSLVRSAVQALAKFGPEAKDAVPQLAPLLADNDKELRKSVAITLAKIGPDAKAAVSNLADALKETDADFRTEVLNALAAIGPPAKAAVPALIMVFEINEKAVTRKCAATLGKIAQDKDSVKQLILALNHENNLIRIGAAMSLGEVGPAAKTAHRQLALHAQDDLDPQVRNVASSALAKVMAKP